MDGLGLLGIMWLFGIAGAIVAKLKGNPVVMWFAISAIVPFIGLMAAVFTRSDSRELRRQCPGCGRILKLHDALCTSCGTELEFPDVAIASEASMRRRAV
jgi:hypothetical protein